MTIKARLKSGELRAITPGKYHFFKGGTYQVLAIAQDSETGSFLVICKELFGAEQVYASPLNKFASEVDHKKYPKVNQEYRFERVDE